MKTILINHPQGVITLKELQEDVNIAQKRIGSHEFAFTTQTVQALIDRIIKDSETIDGLKSREKELTEKAEMFCEAFKDSNESYLKTIEGAIKQKELIDTLRTKNKELEEIVLSVNQYGKLKDNKFTYVNSNGNEFVNKLSNMFL